MLVQANDSIQWPSLKVLLAIRQYFGDKIWRMMEGRLGEHLGDGNRSFWEYFRGVIKAYR